MVNLSAIFESHELHNAVAAINALLAKTQNFQRASGLKTFPELALGRTFNASEVIDIVHGNQPTYPGMKEVLSSGLVGWTLPPNNREIQEALMTQAVLEHMDRAERAAGLVDQPMNFERDIVSRYVLIGMDFISEIYDAFGGYQAFTRSSSAEILSVLLQVHEKAINTTVQALTYLHYGADWFEDPEYDFAPSLNRAVTIFSELKKQQGVKSYKSQFVSRSLLHRRWSGTKQTLALVYAASTIKVNRKTLLQVMLSGNFSYQAHSRYLTEWLGRSRYICEHIFKKMDDLDLHRTSSRLFSRVQPRAFRPSKLKPVEHDIVRAQFRKKFRKSTM